MIKIYIHLLALTFTSYSALELTRLILIHWSHCFDIAFLFELPLIWIPYSVLWIFMINKMKSQKNKQDLINE